MRRVLITGGHGQLGIELARLLSRQYWVFVPSKEELDVTQKSVVEQYVQDVKPYAIIHAAAFTNVDSAEINPGLPILVNAMGTRFIAAAAEQVGARLLYISTDYVFDGTQQSPYTEDDAPSPINVYGMSKLAGEKFASSLCSRYSIIRTSWLYGKFGDNFVTKIIEMSKKEKKLRIVADQYGSPTNVVDLAAFLHYLLQIHSYGIYHASNQGSCSRYEFATMIAQLKGIKKEIIACRTEELPVIARRPKNSVLVSNRGTPPLRNWITALEEFIDEDIQELTNGNYSMSLD